MRQLTYFLLITGRLSVCGMSLAVWLHHSACTMLPHVNLPGSTCIYLFYFRHQPVEGGSVHTTCVYIIYYDMLDLGNCMFYCIALLCKRILNQYMYNVMYMYCGQSLTTMHSSCLYMYKAKQQCTLAACTCTLLQYIYVYTVIMCIDWTSPILAP